MREILLAQGPDSSVGGVPVGYCPDEVHVEKEKVQVKVQVEEGETHGRNKVRNKERTNNQVAHVDDHADDMTRTNTFLSHAV